MTVNRLVIYICIVQYTIVRFQVFIAQRNSSVFFGFLQVVACNQKWSWVVGALAN
jgi:hypothetical protein